MILRPPDRMPVRWCPPVRLVGALVVAVALAVALPAGATRAGADEAPTSAPALAREAQAAGAATGRGSFGGRTTTWRLRSGGRWRTVLVHLPERGVSSGPMPLLLVFHGHGETASAIERITGFDRLSDELGFVVAYPQGVDRSWNDGRGVTAASRLGIDDVAFVRQLIALGERSWSVDPSRVYAAGFSNGAVLAQRLGCQLSGELAGIASVSGMLAAPLRTRCASRRPLPVLLVAGTSDPVMPYDGGRVHSRVGGAVLSAGATAGLWARRDGCTTSSVVTLPAAPGDGTSVVLRTYHRCAPGGAVELVSVVGGVHRWPGGDLGGTPVPVPLPFVPTLSAGLAALRARPFSASQAVWSFLAPRRLRRPAEPAGRPGLRRSAPPEVPTSRPPR